MKQRTKGIEYEEALINGDTANRVPVMMDALVLQLTIDILWLFCFWQLIGTDWEHLNQTSGRSGTALVLRLIKERPMLTKHSLSLEPETTDIAVYFYVIMSINRRVQRL